MPSTDGFFKTVNMDSRLNLGNVTQLRHKTSTTAAVLQSSTAWFELCAHSFFFLLFD